MEGIKSGAGLDVVVALVQHNVKRRVVELGGVKDTHALLSRDRFGVKMDMIQVCVGLKPPVTNNCITKSRVPTSCVTKFRVTKFRVTKWIKKQSGPRNRVDRVQSGPLNKWNVSEEGDFSPTLTESILDEAVKLRF